MRLGRNLSKLLKHLGKTLTVLSLPAIASLATMPVSSQQRTTPSLEDIDCPIRFQISYKGESMRCGYLHVLENRDQKAENSYTDSCDRFNSLNHRFRPQHTYRTKDHTLISMINSLLECAEA